MQEKLTKILFSTRLTAFLFIAFAAAMAIGTFLDAGQDTSPTPYTRTLIYNAWWFEAIMGLFVVNFLGNVIRFRLYKRDKWATGVLHFAFIFILLGAFITRYISFEGKMHIREGQTADTFLSQETYLTAYIDGTYEIDGVPQRLPITREVDFSPRLDNDFKIETHYNKQPVHIVLEKFIHGAEEDIRPDPNGDYYLKIVESSGGAPHNHFLKMGEVQNIHNLLFALNKPTKGAINLQFQGDSITIKSPFGGHYRTMATQTQGPLVKDSLQTLQLRALYDIGGHLQIVFPKPITKGVFDVVEKSNLLKNTADGLLLRITTNGETKQIGLLGGKGIQSPFKQIRVGGLDFAFSYGAKLRKLPFSIKLNNFEAERYPGTEQRYAAFSSQVTVLDKSSGNFDYKIYMNNILDHGGYRFFQSSFDPDEKGTVLSVNHDYWGTLFTYIGYFLLYLGMLAILFAKHTRFADLRNRLNTVKAKKSRLTFLLFLTINAIGFSQTPSDHQHTLPPSGKQIDSILSAHITPQIHADAFGKLVIQDLSGRMMPVNTYASELLRKLSKHDTYKTFDADQVFLSIQERPRLWYHVPIIYLKPKKGDSIRHIIHVDQSKKYVRLADFFTPDGRYKLAPYLNDAYKATIPNGFQKEFKETDQRVNLLYNTIQGTTLRIFPLPEDSNNTWVSSIDYQYGAQKVKDSLYDNFIRKGFSAYLMALNTGKKTNDFTQANKLLEAFKKTQHRYGSAVMLSEQKIKTEVLYNKYDIFKKLFSWYLYAGTLLFIFLIIEIFKPRNKFLNLGIKILIGSTIALFILHTAGLLTRWYISGHAPWSDAYESMIYVAWATQLFGLIFGRKSNLTIAATAFVTAMILMIAHWNWMDPAIANLQPVLNSYWLMIHVAVIVASYGPFTLGMILGIVSLILMIFTTPKNKSRMALNIQELTLINEMSLTVGLVMLTIGNFLGGMWANESWGRYWGWDPKETWALISIMIYAFVIHMRLVPGLRGRWFFNLMSILAFASILMTYFGVNFYLAGLHSYASGDQVVSIKFILIACGIIAILAGFAYLGYARFYKK